LVGCEWESSDSDWGSWSDAYSWVNFSGTYRDPAGQYLVREFGVGGTVSGRFVLATAGTNLVATFSGVVPDTPIVGGSVSVTDGNETFTDPGGGGTLTGNRGGTGSLNYDTGAITVDFFQAPAPGQSIVVTYEYFAAGTPENPVPGSTVEIYTLTVDQVGDSLTFIDNTGGRYTGRITGLRTAGGDSTGSTSGQVIAQFEVTGSPRGQEIRIVGAFYGVYSAPLSGLNTGTLGDRRMEATWIEAGGRTGDIVGVAASVEVTVFFTTDLVDLFTGE
jgi:hypothetical protein